MTSARGEPDAGRLARPVRRCGPGKRTARKSGAAPRPDSYIFSRYIVGWMASPAETGELAEAFIADTLARHGIGRDQLTLHADRGTSMTSKPVAQLLVRVLNWASL
jgi:transposase InsO family protein